MTGFDPRRFGDFADRAYMHAKGFQDYGLTYATPLPGEEFPAARDCRLTPLHETLKAKGAVHTQTFGWERPKWFSLDGREEEHSYRRNNVFEVVRDECTAVRERVGLIDLTGFAKYDVTGADAEAFLNRVLANRMPRRDGGIALAHFLSKNGRILGEATVTRISNEHFYLLSAASAELRDLDHLVQQVQAGEQVEIRNTTEERGVVVLAGPKARDVLSGLTDASLENADFPWRTAQQIEIAGIPTLALRINYVGELGWELHPAMADLPALYAAVWAAGETQGIADFGLYALNSLRMEKGYRGWGAELTNEVTMLEADMARFYASAKEDFVGKAATETNEAGPLRLVYFEVEAQDADVRGGEPIFLGDTCVGVTTSGGYGYAVEKSLGFGYVPPEQAEPGSVIDIGLLDARCRATVLAEPDLRPSQRAAGQLMAALPDRCEVVVVGGGVIGVSVAYHLAEAGIQDVVLLERKELTSGTTWHAAGLVGQLRTSINMTQLARYTSQLYRGLEEDTGQALAIVSAVRSRSRRPPNGLRSLSAVPPWPRCLGSR
jgi:dimethylglycine dehydrogenase